MSTSSEADFDLEKLFLPAWAQEEPAANRYAKYTGTEGANRGFDGRSGERRPQRRDGAQQAAATRIADPVATDRPGRGAKAIVLRVPRAGQAPAGVIFAGRDVPATVASGKSTVNRSSRCPRSSST